MVMVSLGPRGCEVCGGGGGRAEERGAEAA